LGIFDFTFSEIEKKLLFLCYYDFIIFGKEERSLSFSTLLPLPPQVAFKSQDIRLFKKLIILLSSWLFIIFVMKNK